MGYTTEFKGSFKFDRPVDEKLKDYINDFSNARHVKRDPEKFKALNEDWERYSFNGNLGDEGEYITKPDGLDKDARDVVGMNDPPGKCPGLWCQWIISKNGTKLKWDGAEKFYKYTEWLEYLIKNFIAPSGYVLNGHMYYRGEDSWDKGYIEIVNNKVTKVPLGDIKSMLESMIAVISILESEDCDDDDD